MYLMWHESYSVGYDPIDSQHKRLFSISNDLVDAVARPGGSDEKELRKLIGDLLNYTRTHFAEEERLMQQGGFPDFQSHKQLHDAFDDRIREIEEQVRNGETREAASILPALVGDWLLDHIAAEDQKYSAYVKA